MRNYINLLFNKFNLQKTIKILLGILIVVLSFILVLFLNENDILFIKEYRNILILVGLLISLIIVLLLLAFFIYIINSISRITEYAETLAKGKLNVNDIDFQGNNSFSILAKAINDMKSNIIFFIDNTKNNIIILSDSIENMIKSMGIAHDGNRQIASTMEIFRKNLNLNLI